MARIGATFGIVGQQLRKIAFIILLLLLQPSNYEKETKEENKSKRKSETIHTLDHDASMRVRLAVLQRD